MKPDSESIKIKKNPHYVTVHKLLSLYCWPSQYHLKHIVNVTQSNHNFQPFFIPNQEESLLDQRISLCLSYFSSTMLSNVFGQVFLRRLSMTLMDDLLQFWAQVALCLIASFGHKLPEIVNWWRVVVDHKCFHPQREQMICGPQSYCSSPGRKADVVVKQSCTWNG